MGLLDQVHKCFNYMLNYTCSLSRREELSDCLSAKGQKNILILMFSRKLGQKVFEGEEFKSEVIFN